MNRELKIKLLKRKFQSLSYIEEFIKNYQTFIQTGQDAFEIYKKYRKNHPEFKPNKIVDSEEFFWEKKVLPNFKGMLLSSNEALENAKNGYKGTVRSLAGDFRGLSRGFDGVEEEFMDVKTPQLREKFLQLWKQTSNHYRIDY